MLISAATIGLVPLALLFSQVEFTPTHGSFVFAGMFLVPVPEIALIGIISGEG